MDRAVASACRPSCMVSPAGKKALEPLVVMVCVVPALPLKVSLAVIVAGTVTDGGS